MSKKICQESLKDARALMVAGMRLSGMRDEDIAKQLGLYPDTVGKIIRRAEKNGLYGQLRTSILKSLAPVAIKIYEKNMAANLAKDEPELDAARDVLKGMALFGDGTKSEGDHLDEAVEELQILMTRTRRVPMGQGVDQDEDNQPTPTGGAPGLEDGPDSILDGELCGPDDDQRAGD